MVASSASTDGLTVKEWLERIDNKIDDLTDCTGKLAIQTESNKSKLGSHDSDLNRHEKMMDDLDKKMDNISTRSNFLDGVTGILAVIAGILGVKQ